MYDVHRRKDSSRIRDTLFTLSENTVLTDKTHLLRFVGDTALIQSPGQFVMLELPSLYLRRPFSVCDWDEKCFTVLVERIGSGTELLHKMPTGIELSILTGLGNGFSLPPYCINPVLIGGGSGLSPLVGLARRLIDHRIYPKVILGFKNVSERFGEEFFPGLEVRYTEDIFEALDLIPHDYFYACGSESLMLELCHHDSCDGQIAFDVRMGCGFGVCMGCAKRTKYGMKRVCKDGPVFCKEELIWED